MESPKLKLRTEVVWRHEHFVAAQPGWRAVYIASLDEETQIVHFKTHHVVGWGLCEWRSIMAAEGDHIEDDNPRWQSDGSDWVAIILDGGQTLLTTHDVTKYGDYLYFWKIVQPGDEFDPDADNEDAFRHANHLIRLEEQVALSS